MGHPHAICHNCSMCGRYRLSRRKQLVAEYFDAVPGEDEWNPRYNIAPTRPVPIIRQHPKEPRRELSLVGWGLIPSWAKDQKISSHLVAVRKPESVLSWRKDLHPDHISRFSSSALLTAAPPLGARANWKHGCIRLKRGRNAKSCVACYRIVVICSGALNVTTEAHSGVDAVWRRDSCCSPFLSKIANLMAPRNRRDPHATSFFAGWSRLLG